MAAILRSNVHSSIIAVAVITTSCSSGITTASTTATIRSIARPAGYHADLQSFQLEHDPFAGGFGAHGGAPCPREGLGAGTFLVGFEDGECAQCYSLSRPLCVCVCVCYCSLVLLLLLFEMG